MSFGQAQIVFSSYYLSATTSETGGGEPTGEDSYQHHLSLANLLFDHLKHSISLESLVSYTALHLHSTHLFGMSMFFISTLVKSTLTC